MESLNKSFSRIGRDPADYVGPMSVIDGDDIALTSTYSVQDMLQEREETARKAAVPDKTDHGGKS